MSRRDAAAAGHRARHARARLQATLADGSGGLLAIDQAGGGEGAKGFDDGGMEPGKSGTGALKPGDVQARTHAGLPPAAAGPGRFLRWRVSLRIAVAVGLLAVTAAALLWWQTASGRPEILPLNSAGHGSSAARDRPAGAHVNTEASGNDAMDGIPQAGSGQVVVIHVSGAVGSPGVVTLPAGSRVHEAIAAAGGAAPDANLEVLNLALVAEDGQKIHVPRTGERLPEANAPQGAAPVPAAAAASGAAAGGGTKVNINTAGVDELDALPKVGPVLAQRIVDWRTEHGRFSSVEELDAVDGVGAKMLETLLPLVTV